jgi:uncharacterized protein YgbK (DUF1537 family)
MIVADDLTGAADSAARCRQAGLRAVVLLQDAEWPAAGMLPAALAVCTDSRHLPPDEAAARVQAALAAAPRSRALIWHKKIDSTLRGNIGAELDAMLKWMGEAISGVVCPAFPAQGRGLRDGYLVHSETPPRQVHLLALLRGQSVHPVAQISLEVVQAGPAALAQALAEAASGGARLVVVDALTDGDLTTIVDAAHMSLDTSLFCGSAGLVGALATRVAPQWSQGAQSAMTASVTPAGSILSVVGSGSKIAHAQIAHLAVRSDVRVRELDRTWSQVDVVSANGHPVGNWLVHLAPPPPGLALEGAVARAEAARLADLSHVVVDRLHPGALIVVGGDTASYVMRVLGIRQLEVVEELLPGVPLLVGEDQDGVQRTVVLKAGNFGDEATLARLHDLLQQRQDSASSA